MPRYNAALLNRMEMQKANDAAGGKVQTEEEVKKVLQLWPDDDPLAEMVEQPPVTDSAGDAVEKNQTMIYKADISLFDDNPDNHWNRMTGEKWNNFVETIREHGIVVPLIVRTKPDGHFEILAGHNRKYGAIEAGLTELPYIVQNVDDTEASVILGITNNQRERISDLEWGWSYRNTYEALKKAEGRPKASAPVQEPSAEKNVPNLGTFPTNGRTMEIVAKMHGVGKGTVERKMRLTYLVKQLYEQCMKEKYTQQTMVDLSYLTQANQTNVAQMMSIESFVVTAGMAKVLREKAREHELSIDEIREYCREEGQVIEKPKRPRRYSVDDALFPAHIKKGERETYIIRALEYIREHRIRLDDEMEAGQ